MLKSLRNRLATIVLIAAAAAGVILPFSAAQASTDATTAFNNLLGSVSTTGPGYYTSAERNMFVGGNLRTFVPNTTVNLISVTPPQIAAGCGGISIIFGGFSFLNGQQFQQLVQNIMQNAVGYAVYIGIRILCPMCSDILQELQKIAHLLASHGINSCQIAESMVNGGLNLMGVTVPSTKSINGAPGDCSQTAASAGAATDFTAAETSICQGTSAALGWLDSQIQSVGSALGAVGSAHEAGAHVMVDGNPGWAGLTWAGYSDTYVKEIILSIAGTSSNVKDPSSSTGTAQTSNFPGWTGVGEGGTSGGVAFTADVQGQALADILLWGADPSSTATQLASLPQGATLAVDAQQAATRAAALGYGALPMLVCGGLPSGSPVPAPASTPSPGMTSGLDNSRLCDVFIGGTANTVKSVAAAGSNPLITTNGLIVSIVSTLNSAVAAVAADQPIPASAIELMQITPLPLYKVINIAAVYPDVASQIVNTYAQAIGYLIVSEVVESWLRTPQSAAPGADFGAAASDLMQQMRKVSAGINTSLKNVAQETEGALRFQNDILLQIKQVNDVMYASLASTNIQGNLLFTQGTANGISGTMAKN